MLEISFKKAYGLKQRTKISKDTINVTDFYIFEELKDLLNNELKIVIELRNKLAHGQWEYPFTDDFKSISSSHKKLFEAENYLTLKFKRTIINSLLFMMRDLVVSYKTLQRDFQNHYVRLKYSRLNIKNRSYNKYRLSLISKRNRGINKKAENRKIELL